VTRQKRYVSSDGTEELVDEVRWSPKRTFICTHPDHVGSRMMNRDIIASVNHGLNVILFAAGEIDSTNWKIGKIEV